MKKIYITMGDPRGISPEIILKSLKEILNSDLNNKFIPVIIGDEKILKTYADKYNADVFNINYLYIKSSGSPGSDSLNYINKGVELCMENPESALVTGPVTKKSISMVRKDFRGHTEYIAELAGAGSVAMTFIAPLIKMSLLTTHFPLKKVPSEISITNITGHVEIIQSGLNRWFKMDSPRFVLCSLNPHAGENGLLGNEEKDILMPAVGELSKKGINITGPLSPHEALKKTMEGKFDFIVSLYHDQILTALKIFLGPAVNFTMGLPFVRTSPDHGPGIDITGKDIADPGSMKAAIKLAINLYG